VLQTFDSEQLLDPAAVATEVSLMRQCVSEMIDVSNDLLDVSALRRGMLRVNVVPTALHDFLRALKQDPRCGDVIIAAERAGGRFHRPAAREAGGPQRARERSQVRDCCAAAKARSSGLQLQLLLLQARTGIRGGRGC
jgi:hypothetical protein